MDIKDFTESELYEELKRRKESKAFNDSYAAAKSALSQIPIYQTWKATTEGDVEGRSTKNLGTLHGSFPDLALQFGGAAVYSIKLEPAIDETLLFQPVGAAYVSVVKILGHGTNNMVSPGEIKAIQEWIGDEYTVERGQYYRSVFIRRNK